MRQEGSAPIIFLLLFLILFVGIYLFLSTNKSKPLFSLLTSKLTTTQTPDVENGNDGDRIAAPDGSATFFFPVGSFSRPLTLQAWVVPGCGSPKEPYLRRLGSSVEIKVVENPETQPLKEFDITIPYHEESIIHIDENTLAIYRCADTGMINPYYSERLPSEVNQTNKTVSAKSKLLGNFDIVGKLICEDDKEPDNDMNKIQGDQDITFGFKSPGAFDVIQDVDWYFIEIRKGKKYSIETVDVSSGVVPLIELSPDASTVVQSNKNNPGQPLDVNQGLFFGSVQIKVFPSIDSKVGCSANYNLLVKEF